MEDDDLDPLRHPAGLDRPGAGGHRRLIGRAGDLGLPHRTAALEAGQGSDHLAGVDRRLGVLPGGASIRRDRDRHQPSFERMRVAPRLVAAGQLLRRGDREPGRLVSTVRHPAGGWRARRPFPPVPRRVVVAAGAEPGTSSSMRGQKAGERQGPRRVYGRAPNPLASSANVTRGESVEAQGVDAVEFRDGQRDQWNKAATGWDKWSSPDRRGRGPGERPAGGYGRRGARKPGAGHRLRATASRRCRPPAGRARRQRRGDRHRAVMLDFAAKRAADAGIENIEFVESEAIALDFPERQLRRRPLALGRDLRARGRGGAEQDPGLPEAGQQDRRFVLGHARRGAVPGVPMRTAMKTLDVPPPPPGTPGPLSRPTPEALTGGARGRRVLRRRGGANGGGSGLRVRGGVHPVIREIAPPITAMIAPHPPEAQEAAWQAIEDAIGELASDDGTLHLERRAAGGREGLAPRA